MIESLLSPGHLILIGLAALLIVGPKRLPEVGRGVGKALREFKKGASEMTDELKMEIHDHEQAKVATALPAAAAPPTVEIPVPAPVAVVPLDAPSDGSGGQVRAASA